MTEVQENIIKLLPGKTLVVEPINGKCLLIDTSSVAFLDIQMDENNDHIQSVCLEGKYTIKLEDKFHVRIGKVISLYEIMYLVVSKDKRSVLMFSSTPNKTTTFLLPLLDKSKLDLRFDTYFVNAFIDKEGKCLSLKYRFTGTEQYKEFEKTLISNPMFVSHEDCDTYHVMYTFRIPKQFENDISNFMEGKYSLFSKTLRQRIMKFYGGEDSVAIMQIIRQDEGLKQKLEEYLNISLPIGAELASKPILKHEIYNINN